MTRLDSVMPSGPATPRQARAPWGLAIALACAATASAVLLTGVSAWFLGAVALAGLGPAAFAFNFHTPAAFVRLLALTKTVGKYGERVAGHRATLSDQVRRRVSLFNAMAQTPSTRTAGWQLGNQDRLADYMEDVEDLDSARLRVGLPMAMLGAAFAVLLVATAWLAPLALAGIVPATAAVGLASAWMRPRAAARWLDLRKAQRDAGRRLDAALAAAVPLQAERAFGDTLAAGFVRFEAAERARLGQRHALAIAECATAMAGPSIALSVMVAAWHAGERGEGLLLPAFLAFAWLALAETALTVPRMVFSSVRTHAARENLAVWSAGADQEPAMIRADETPAALVLYDVPRRSPDGRRLGEPLSAIARAGRPTVLVGGSGTGKTTLLKQIAGWIGDDGEGRFAGDGTVLPAAVRRAMSHLCLHDCAILADTIRENLLAPAAGDAACWDALRAVELEGRIVAAGGLDAWIDQDMLSLGEAQRLNLARALLSNCPIVLLDEPTEHLDAKQGERIFARVLERLQNRIVVYSSHRLGTTAIAAACLELR